MCTSRLIAKTMFIEAVNVIHAEKAHTFSQTVPTYGLIGLRLRLSALESEVYRPASVYRTADVTSNCAPHHS